MTKRWNLRLTLLVAATAVTLLGCSTAPDRVTAADRARAAAAATTTTAADAAKTATAQWTKVIAPATCQCSDGTTFTYWTRAASPTKVLFFLEGGGACFSKETCGSASTSYTRNLAKANGPVGKGASGIFDLTDARNPFRDYSMVYVPYCTGDVHLGNTTHDYGNGVVIHHNGYVNASTALAATAAMFPDAERVVVAGASAGSAGAPLYGGLVHDVLPDAAVTVLADSSGAYPGSPGITAAIGTLWGTTNAIPPWPTNAGMTAERWSLPGLFVRSTKHDPDVVMGRFDYAYDDVQAAFSSLAGVGADDLLTAIDGNTKMIEDAGVKLHNWVQPGTDHTVVGKAAFFTTEQNGTKLSDWVAGLIAGRDVPSIHCTDCGKPA